MQWQSLNPENELGVHDEQFDGSICGALRTGRDTRNKESSITTQSYLGIATACTIATKTVSGREEEGRMVADAFSEAEAALDLFKGASRQKGAEM